MKNNTLAEYKKIITSQNGEDGVIERIFEIIKPKNKWCVEFGAVDGKMGSNTWNLINNCEWKAVLIEAHPAYFRDLLKRYKNVPRVHTLNVQVNFEGKNTLDEILANFNAPVDVDFVSIDIDGVDYHIWDSMKSYRPRVIMIEYNSRIYSDMSFVQPKDFNIQWGSSLKSIVELGKKKGYELIYADSGNAIFVIKEIFDIFKIENEDILDVACEKEQESKFFQMHDGSIVLYDVSPKDILLFKKKPKVPLFVYQNGSLISVPIHKERLTRFIKDVVKKIPFYYQFIYPIAEHFYDRQKKNRQRNFILIHEKHFKN